MTPTERKVSAILRKYPLGVVMTKEAIRRGVRRNRCTGLLVGISNGFLKVRLSNHKTVGSYHPSFWEAA